MMEIAQQLCSDAIWSNYDVLMFGAITKMLHSVKEGCQEMMEIGLEEAAASYTRAFATAKKVDFTTQQKV
jgi:hypothetical protein